MSDVKRYKKNGEILGRALVAAKDGEYVRYHDYAALRARIEAVTEERDEWVRDVWTARGFQAEAEARTERAEAALATARRLANDAIKMCEDGYPVSAYNVARQVIRALANEAET